VRRILRITFYLPTSLARRLAGELDQGFLHARDLGFTEDQVAVAPSGVGVKRVKPSALYGHLTCGEKLEIAPVRAYGIKCAGEGPR